MDEPIEGDNAIRRADERTTACGKNVWAANRAKNATSSIKSGKGLKRAIVLTQTAPFSAMMFSCCDRPLSMAHLGVEGVEFW